MLPLSPIRVVVCGLLAAACHRAPPPEFGIASTSPELRGTPPVVMLNEPLTVYFTAPVAGLSVTPDTVQVLDSRGERVPGTLQNGSHWVSFVPQPPLTPELRDGSFLPGERYELRIAGLPRVDAVKALDGRRLVHGASLPFRVAALDEAPPGLPAPLRPQAAGVPLWLHASDAPGTVPADAPILYLRFSAPLLPGSVTAAAFDVRSLNDLAALLPRRVRAITLPGDALPGCSVAIELGAQPTRAGGGHVRLRPGDWLSMELRPGPLGLLDYRGEPLALPAPPQFWSVVAGGAAELYSLPGDQGEPTPSVADLAGFERIGGGLRPRVRVEAGDGRLGSFHPKVDTVLRPGVAFDRGDGTLVQSDGASFAFTSVQIPAGVVVTLDASTGPVQVLCTGAMHVQGRVVLRGGAAPVDDRQLAPAPAAGFLALGASTLLAAGDLQISGEVHAEVPVRDGATPLVVASAAQIRLAGELPYRTLLVVEAGARDGGQARVVGPRGQTLLRSAWFRYGAAPGASLAAESYGEWVQIPDGCSVAAVQLEGAAEGLEVAWQAAPADPVLRERPDPAAERRSRWEPVHDGMRLPVQAGTFVRLRLRATAVGGQAPPELGRVRLLLP
jgi:hypothetical protein